MHYGRIKQLKTYEIVFSLLLILLIILGGLLNFTQGNDTLSIFIMVIMVICGIGMGIVYFCFIKNERIT